MMISFWLSYTILIDYKRKLKRFVIVARNFWGEMIKVHKNMPTNPRLPYIKKGETPNS